MWRTRTVVLSRRVLYHGSFGLQCCRYYETQTQFVKEKDPQGNVTVDWDRTVGNWEEEELRAGLGELFKL